MTLEEAHMELLDHLGEKVHVWLATSPSRSTPGA